MIRTRLLAAALALTVAAAPAPPPAEAAFWKPDLKVTYLSQKTYSFGTGSATIYTFRVKNAGITEATDVTIVKDYTYKPSATSWASPADQVSTVSKIAAGQSVDLKVQCTVTGDDQCVGAWLQAKVKDDLDTKDNFAKVGYTI